MANNVLGIIASPRRYGNCHSLVHLFLDYFKNSETPHEVEMVFLNDLNIAQCKGCLSCVYKGKCSLDDEMEKFIDKIMAADGVVVAAPTYIFGPGAIIKNLIDRSLILSNRLGELANKKSMAVTISVSGKAGWNYTSTAQLSQFAAVYGYKVLNTMEAYAPGPGEVLLQEGVIKEVLALANDLHQAMKDPTCVPEIPNNRCPYCLSDIYKIFPDGKIQCGICGSLGEFNAHENKLQLEKMTQGDDFYNPIMRKKHIEDWIVPSKDNFLANRVKIKQELERYGIISHK